MQRRELLGVLGATAAGLVAVTGGQANAAQGHQGKAHEDSLKACGDCAKMCDETFHHCYVQVAEGKRDHAKPLHFTSDCAAFCGLASCMIARHSPLMSYSCHACADACKACAAECDKHDSPEMKACAKSCRVCETACREMVATMSSR